MASKSRGRNAVLIARVADGWQPASINAIPQVILSAKFYARKKPLYAALAIADAYNRARLPGNGGFDGTWALCVVAVGQQGVLSRLSKHSRGDDRRQGGGA